MVEEHHYETDGCIYYFGYGALVNPTSRQRRGITTCQAQAASLPDYRLTFAYGGAANICKAQGWEVHGILMRCASPKDFEVLSAFDTGYDCIQVNVVPYNDYWNESRDSAEEGDSKCGYRNSLRGKRPIKANVFVMHRDEDENCDLPMDKLPQERYLRVIASGMQSYGVDDGYIEDQIMGVSYIPSRKPADYLRFPKASKSQPSMTLVEWELECGRRLEEASDQKKSLLVLRLGRTVIQVDDDHDPENPFCVWVRGRLVGPQDCTWVIIQTLFDPDLPRINSPEEVTIVHQEWAENQMMEKFEQAGIRAKAILQVDIGDVDDRGAACHIMSDSSTSCSGTTAESSLPVDDPSSNTEDDTPVESRRRQSRKGTTSSKSIRSTIRSGIRGVFSR